VELFGTTARFSGFAFARELGTLLGGAPVPIVSVMLVAWMDGQPWGVAVYIVLLAAVTTIAVALSPETYRRDIIAEPAPPEPSGPERRGQFATVDVAHAPPA
jgi:MFS transporter, MHS family, shikimate and dehydroshikimate transport protein